MNTVYVVNQFGKEIPYEVALLYMEDGLRELVSIDTIFSDDAVTEQEFFDRYCEAYEKQYGEPFFLSTRNPQF